MRGVRALMEDWKLEHPVRWTAGGAAGVLLVLDVSALAGRTSNGRVSVHLSQSV